MIIKGYHGTSHEFAPEDLRLKAFLTDNPELAARFGNKVMHLEVEAARPYEIDWEGCSWGGGFFTENDALFNEFIEYAVKNAASDKDEEEEERVYWQDNGMCTDMFADMLSDKGYDLLILYNVLEEEGYSETEYVVLPGAVVRSAQG